MAADTLEHLTETEGADDPVGAALVFVGASVAGFCAAEGANYVVKVLERRKEKEKERGL